MILTKSNRLMWSSSLPARLGPLVAFLVVANVRKSMLETRPFLTDTTNRSAQHHQHKNSLVSFTVELQQAIHDHHAVKHHIATKSHLRSSKDSSVNETSSRASPRRSKQRETVVGPITAISNHTNVSTKTVAVNQAISSSLATTTSSTSFTKTTTTTTTTTSFKATSPQRTKEEHTNTLLGAVQAWAESDSETLVRSRRRPSRKVYTNIADIPHIPFDNATINPSLPSNKVNSATMWNMEIPIDYSIAADMMSTVPWSNVSTVAFVDGCFYSGFRNQIMAFTTLVMDAQQKSGHGQILLRSLRMKDTFGTNQLMEFGKLWDVTHWNSHYPHLPRLVDYDPILHSQFNYAGSSWYRTTSAFQVNDTATTTSPKANNKAGEKWYGAHGLFASPFPMRPYASWPQGGLFAGYMRYALKGRGPFVAKTAKQDASTGKMVGIRNPAEILMLQGAMRPHPNFQAIIDRLLAESGLAKGSGNEYMTLHARVEPDMQKHPVCRDKKVMNLTDIFDFMERQWPDKPPGVSRIFMPINRQYMEMEGYVNERDPSQTNWIAVQNLKALNHARDHGLWGGRVKVLEFGANALVNTSYADRPSTGGAMLNFFIGVGAKIFIGTEVSSYSHDILATRFFRNATENYMYLPDGLHDWTPPGTMDPPGFGC